ncbi:hypothetical protein GCM10022419_080510 [Nonomuraea rosea]|uniref:Uncharacterized protein n=1 Tax=Nonomuraea rosea TaxID=638574 RepID=A0ABP6YNZ2_9ACTN
MDRLPRTGFAGLMLGMIAVLIGTGRARIHPILGSAFTPGLLVLRPGTGLALASGLTLIRGMGVGLLMQSITIITVNNAPGAAVLGVIAFALSWSIREVPLRDRTPADLTTAAV